MKNLKTCPKGHRYYKSSDCPVCPICENMKKPVEAVPYSVGAQQEGARKCRYQKPSAAYEVYSGAVVNDTWYGSQFHSKLQNVLKSQGLSFKRK